MILRSLEPNSVSRVNSAFTEAFGLTSEALAPIPLLDCIHPDDREQLQQKLEFGEGRTQARHQTHKGEWISLEWRVRTHDHQVVALGVPHKDPLPSPNPMQAGMAPMRATLTQTLEAMVHIIEAKTDGLRCSILLVNDERTHVTVGAGPSLPDQYNHSVEGLRIGPTVGSCGTAAYWGVPVVVEDIFTDPLWQNLREAANIAGVAACWSFPITASTGGDVLGAIALYDRKPNSPSQHQLDVLEIAARMVGLAIERDRLELQLRQATKMEAVGVLAGGVAHDFNNLLAAIMGNAELAMIRLPEGSDASLNLKRIVTASLSATDLCNQMLAYAGRGATSAELLDCNALVRELGDLLKVAMSKKVSLDYLLHPSPLGVLADRSQLRQVVMNLITNAADAIGTNEGSIVLGTKMTQYTAEELELSHPNYPLEGGDYVSIWVTDTGPGMASETQAKIFDPFFSTKPNGRGLGLAAVQGIVRGHGGTITVESMPGTGTTVSLLLPCATLSADELPLAQSERVEGVSACVLIGDDEQVVREVLVAMLEQAGYRVLQAVDGQEVVDIYRREADNIDCVLLDLNMPRLDGAEAFAELLQIRSDVCVVLSSGFTEQEMLNRFQGAGLAGVIQKPTQMHVLLAKIADALRKSVAERSATA